MSYNHKALITFYHDAANSHVTAFNVLEFLVNAFQLTKCNESAKRTCKNHTASAENSYYLLLSNT